MEYFRDAGVKSRISGFLLPKKPMRLVLVKAVWSCTAPFQPLTKAPSQFGSTNGS